MEQTDQVFPFLPKSNVTIHIQVIMHTTQDLLAAIEIVFYDSKLNPCVTISFVNVGRHSRMSNQRTVVPVAEQMAGSVVRSVIAVVME